MKLNELETELRAQRPAPDLDFARRLDEWAEAGFPRESGLGPGNAARAGALRRLWDRVSSTPPRRLLIPVGAVATAVVVAGVALTSGDRISGGSGDTALNSTTSSAAQEDAAGAGAGHPPRSIQVPQGGAGAGSEAAAPPASQEYDLVASRRAARSRPPRPPRSRGSAPAAGSPAGPTIGSSTPPPRSRSARTPTRCRTSPTASSTSPTATTASSRPPR